jgi:hypothetical protein
VEALHVDLIEFIESTDDIERAKVEFPGEDPSEFLGGLVLLHTIVLLHVEVREDFDAEVELRMDVADDGCIVIAPVASGQDLDLELEWKLLLQALLEVRIQLLAHDYVLQHYVHFLSIGRPTFLLQSLYKQLLSLVILA